MGADAILIVVSGKITVGLQGGIPGEESKSAFVNETLVEGDIAYFPNARAYWFQEATGKDKAETITVFNVGNWRSIEMGQAFKLMPNAPALSNLHIKHTHPVQFILPRCWSKRSEVMMRDKS